MGECVYTMIFPGKFNWGKLLKKDFIWLANHRCQHGERYLQHPACFFKEKPEGAPVVERIGFLDIETSNLHGNFGYIFSYCIKELDGDILGYCITPDEIRKHLFDKNLMKQLCVDIKKFHRIIVYWGKNYRFDIPFCRTRALKWGFPFPEHKDLVVNDLFDVVKSRLRLHRNRLENACNFLDIPSKEHRLDPDIWQKAMSGDQRALDWIYEHNKEDVVSTEAVWKKVYMFYPNPNTSI